MGNEPTELSLASLELPRLEACVELMFWAAYADGRVDREERAVFERHVNRATAGELTPELIQVVLRGIEEAVRAADRAARVPRIAARLAEPRVQRAALALAAAVAMADGELTGDERAFLEQAGAAMGIGEAEVGRVIEEAGRAAGERVQG